MTKFDEALETAAAILTELYIDPQRRLGEDDSATGIFVRAKCKEDGHYYPVDITELTKESLLVWLRSRGGNNPWAEDCVGLLLGYGPLHPHSATEQ